MWLITHANGDKYSKATKLALEVQSFLKDNGMRSQFSSDCNLQDQPDLVIAIGGDGTIMRAMKEFEAPVFGINAGTLGFLAGAEIKNWKSSVKRLLTGDYEIEKRLALEFVWDGVTYGPFANEVILQHLTYPVQFEAKVNGYVLWPKLNSRGLLVATATGSNAQNFSSGGPSLFPTSNDVVLTPINGQNANTAPFSFPEVGRGGNVEITLLPTKYDDVKVRLSADGVDVLLNGEDMSSGGRILIRRAEKPLLLATFGLPQYIRALSKKGFATQQ